MDIKGAAAIVTGGASGLGGATAERLAKSGAKVLDFGLAKSASRNSDATQAETVTASEVIVGTLPYMAPEQLAGKECNARADIFALGVVLYEMAAGKRPFGGANRAELIANIMRSNPPPLVDVPRQFAHIVEQCLAKDPADRWQSAHDLAIELRWMEQASAAAECSIRQRQLSQR